MYTSVCMHVYTNRQFLFIYKYTKLVRLDVRFNV